MDHAAFAEAVEFLDWRGITKRNSSVAVKDKTQILKLELKFLRTFVKYTVNRYPKYEDLQDLFTEIEDVRQNVEKLHRLASSYRKKEIDDAICNLLDKIKLVKPKMSEIQMEVSRSSESGSFLSDKSAKPNTKQVRMQASRAALGRGEPLVEFIVTLLEDLKELLACELYLLEPSLREGIELLKRKLRSLKGLVSFTSRRCSEDDKLDLLLTYVQAMADNAAYLAYSCLTNKMDGDMARSLALDLSNLVQKIDPVRPEVRQIYIGVLMGSEPSWPKWNLYERDETAVDFLGSLLENTMELLCRDTMPVKDRIENLHVDLKFLQCFLKHFEIFAKLKNSVDLLEDAEVIAILAGCLIYSFFEDVADEERAKRANWMSFKLSMLLNNFKLLNESVRVEKTDISNLPKTDELGALDLLLQNLEELLNDRDDSITLLKDHIKIVQREMKFLQSFMTTIGKQHDEGEKVDLWRRIVRVTYEIEYVIDLAMVKDGLVLHHMLWLSDLIEEIKLIKKEIDQPISDKNIRGSQEADVAEESSTFKLSINNASRIEPTTVIKKQIEKLSISDKNIHGSQEGIEPTTVIKKQFKMHSIFDKNISGSQEDDVAKKSSAC